MSQVKIKSIWTVGQVFIRDTYSKALDQFVPCELFEEYFCECGKRYIYTKKQVLKHLMEDHGLSISEAKQVWANIPEDYSAVNSKTLFVKRGAPTPSDLEGCRILSWDEWQAEMEKARKEECGKKP